MAIPKKHKQSFCESDIPNKQKDKITFLKWVVALLRRVDRK
jgi:hypothetical protein